MPHRVSPTDRIRGHIDELFAQDKQLPEILEDLARLARPGDGAASIDVDHQLPPGQDAEVEDEGRHVAGAPTGALELQRTELQLHDVDLGDVRVGLIEWAIGERAWSHRDREQEQEPWPAAAHRARPAASS